MSEVILNPPKVMPAVHRPDLENRDKPSAFAPGEWAWERDRTYVAGRLPNGEFIMIPVQVEAWSASTGWQLVNADPAAITLAPSIEVGASRRAERPDRYWHGYLDGGAWRSC